MEEQKITKILVSEDEVQTSDARLGVDITACYTGIHNELMVIGLLRGSFIFMTDLVRRIPLRDRQKIGTIGPGRKRYRASPQR